MRKSYLTTLLFLTLTQFGQAQVLDGVYVRGEKESVLFQGVIKSANTKQPLDSVIISVFGSDGTNTKLHLDNTGNFEMLLGIANYKLIYERRNYIQQAEEVMFTHVPDVIKVTKYLEEEKQ